ncbi:hypothetical protein NI26_08385 [Curtobacterium sp. MR_MD2014]|nr:hypothetical protein NI26_08385 [Curtobacterium sp. MR_MD2014]
MVVPGWGAGSGYGALWSVRTRDAPCCGCCAPAHRGAGSGTGRNSARAARARRGRGRGRGVQHARTASSCCRAVARGARAQHEARRARRSRGSRCVWLCAYCGREPRSRPGGSVWDRRERSPVEVAASRRPTAGSAPCDAASVRGARCAGRGARAVRCAGRGARAARCAGRGARAVVRDARAPRRARRTT